MTGWPCWKVFWTKNPVGTDLPHADAAPDGRGPFCVTHIGSVVVDSGVGGFHQVASANWIPWLPQKNPARQDRDFLSY